MDVVRDGIRIGQGVLAGMRWSVRAGFGARLQLTVDHHHAHGSARPHVDLWESFVTTHGLFGCLIALHEHERLLVLRPTFVAILDIVSHARRTLLLVQQAANTLPIPLVGRLPLDERRQGLKVRLFLFPCLLGGGAVKVRLERGVGLGFRWYLRRGAAPCPLP